MINKQKLKKLYDEGLLSKSIIFNECKNFIVSNLKNGYSVNKTLKILELELKEIGIEDIKFNLPGFYNWANRVNKYTGKKNLDLSNLKEYDVKEPEFKAVKEKATSDKKVEVFKNLIK